MKGFAFYTFIPSPCRLVTVLHILGTDAALFLSLGKMATSCIDMMKEVQ